MEKRSWQVTLGLCGSFSLEKNPDNKSSLVCSTCSFPWCKYLCPGPFHASHVTSCRWIRERVGSSTIYPIDILDVASGAE